MEANTNTLQQWQTRIQEKKEQRTQHPQLVRPASDTAGAILLLQKETSFKA